MSTDEAALRALVERLPPAMVTSLLAAAQSDPTLASADPTDPRTLARMARLYTPPSSLMDLADRIHLHPEAFGAPAFARRPHTLALNRLLTRAARQITTRDPARRRNRRIIISMPPRSGKTFSVTQLLPALTLSLDPTRQVVVTSHDPSLATSWSRTVRAWASLPAAVPQTPASLPPEPKPVGPPPSTVKATNAADALADGPAPSGVVGRRPDPALASSLLAPLAERLGEVDAPDPTPEQKALEAHVERLTRQGAATGKAVRPMHPMAAPVSRTAGATSAREWDTSAGGSFVARSVRESLTGRGANCLVVDDPFKDWSEAVSRASREEIWDWWMTVATARLEPPNMLLVVMCMVGDTPVLMADGSEKPLRDVRPGERVATYEEGRLTSSVVLNWASQGPDTVYRIRTKSGVDVRANARHPFLTLVDGEEVWVRAGSLEPGSVLLGTGASTEESSASKTGAANLPTAETGASGTTTSSPGASVENDAHQKHAGKPGSSTGTASLWKTSTGCPPIRAACAPSAVNHRPQAIPEPTGLASSASTTTTSPGEYGGCCATTATWLSGTGSHQKCSKQPLHTFVVGPDEVVSVEVAGVEEVFDLQVDRTENFIAGGVVAHNTRWHTDDLVGRLLSPAYPGNPADWDVVSFPAVAESVDLSLSSGGSPLLTTEPSDRTPAKTVDMYTRSSGRVGSKGSVDAALSDDGPPPSPYLLSPLEPEETDTPAGREHARERWAGVRAATSPRVWSALYQQRPVPLTGAVLPVDEIRWWTTDPELASTCPDHPGEHPARDPGDPRAATVLVDSLTGSGTTPCCPVVATPGTGGDNLVVDSWDLAAGGRDYTVGQRWARVTTEKGTAYVLLGQVRANDYDFPKTDATVSAWATTKTFAPPFEPTPTCTAYPWTGQPHPVDLLLGMPAASTPVPSKILVEDTAFGRPLVDVVKSRRYGPRVEPIRPTGSKETRAEAVSPLVAHGAVRLPHPATRSLPVQVASWGDRPVPEPYRWVDDLVDEVATFPAGAHDDQVDALTQALSWLEVSQVTRAMVIGQRHRPDQASGKPEDDPSVSPFRRMSWRKNRRSSRQPTSWWSDGGRSSGKGWGSWYS